MTVTFWGVRGSVPSPGPHTLRYGGNTTCASVEIDGKVLVLDAGTGIRELGEALIDREKDGVSTAEIFVILTHLHADHIAGFPFFAPLWEVDRLIHLCDYPLNGKPWSPMDLLNGIFFPVQASQVSSDYRRIPNDPLGYLAAHGLEAAGVKVNHPGGAFGYRIWHGGHSFVFIPDNELRPPGKPLTTFDEFVTFCRGTDVLCHDAQYLTHDFPLKHGWGHSQAYDACDLAVAAGVGHLILFHHDPDRSDEALDALQSAAQVRLAPHDIRCTVAYEGLELNID